MSERPAPHRAIELRLRIGADSDLALERALKHFLMKLQQGGVAADGSRDGYDYDWHYMLARDPQMTHERYFAALAAALEARNQKSASLPGSPGDGAAAREDGQA